MKKVFYLIVLAKDARDSSFDSNTNCLLARAGKRMFPDAEVMELVDSMEINNARYSHRWFSNKEYQSWVAKAKEMQDEDVLFKIRLTEK